MTSLTEAERNAAKLRRILENRDGSAVLYRTTIAGPSGQRRDTPVAWVAYTSEGAYELAVWCPPGADCRCVEPAGYMYRGHDQRGQWTVYGYRDGFDGYWLRGWAESAAIAADVLIYGGYAANGNHDSARISRGGWTRYTPREDTIDPERESA